MIYFVKRSIIDLIGRTPVVKFSQNKDVQVLIKLGGMNPSGSIKDVPVLSMIKDAESKGILKKGDTIIESTSGNTGISLAMIGAVRGYKVVLVMPENVSIERIKILRYYGARLIFTPASEGSDGAIRKVREIVRKTSFVYLNQYDNPANWKGHYEITGPMIWKQTQGKITHLVAGIGTGGTIVGTGKRLKEYNPDIKVIGVEPAKPQDIPGLKKISASIRPKIYDESVIDEKIIVSKEEAFKGGRAAAGRGMFLGISSGAAVFAGMKVAGRIKKGTVVVISPDTGYKYLSTKLFGD